LCILGGFLTVQALVIYAKTGGLDLPKYARTSPVVPIFYLIIIMISFNVFWVASTGVTIFTNYTTAVNTDLHTRFTEKLRLQNRLQNTNSTVMTPDLYFLTHDPHIS